MISKSKLSVVFKGIYSAEEERTMGIWLAFRSMGRGIHIQHYGFTSGLPPAHLLPKHMALEQRAISYVTPPLLFNCFDRIHYANILSLSSCTSVTTQQWGSGGINIDLLDNLALRLWLFLRSENSEARTQTSRHLESVGRKESVPRWWPRRYQRQWNQIFCLYSLELLDSFSM